MKRTALAALLLAATGTPPAGAQESGVFVDPDSPAGKEYAIPLEEARRQAAGGSRANPGSGQPLFGEGIERADGSASASDGAGSGTRNRSAVGADAAGRSGSVQRKSGVDTPAAPDIVPGASRSAAIEAAAADGSDGLLTAGIAGAVLAAGLVAALGLRKLFKAQ
jgi:hypothetical protein